MYAWDALLCSKPMRMEVWHFAWGADLALDLLITHHLTVANVFTLVGPLLVFLQLLYLFSGQFIMEGSQTWFTSLKDELSNSPLMSNAVFGFILMGLEKMVEFEFECPCSPTWNGVFSSAFFIIPAVMAFMLMQITQGCICSWKTFSNLVPAYVWLILTFMDGRYLACAMTSWEGRFVIVDKAAPQKWCEPTSEGVVPRQELMRRSQRQFVLSQGIGIILLIVFCVGLIIYYVIRKSCKWDMDANESKASALSMRSLNVEERQPADDEGVGDGGIGSPAVHLL